MAFRFHIQNFQSIPDQTLELAGFTTITGPSNLGKSALIRALRAWAYNEIHPSWIRDSAKECVLTGEWPEGTPTGLHKVTFTKSASVNKYTVSYIDGRTVEYAKMGTDTPQELKDLHFTLLESEREERFNLNFQGQLEPLFLLTDTPTTLTSFLNKIFDIARHERALRSINSDIIAEQREHDKLNVEIQATEGRLLLEESELESTTKLRDTFTAFTTQITEAEAKVTKLDQARAALDQIEELRHRAAKLLVEANTTSALKTVVGKVNLQIRMFKAIHTMAEATKKTAANLLDVKSQALLQGIAQTMVRNVCGAMRHTTSLCQVLHSHQTIAQTIRTTNPTVYEPILKTVGTLGERIKQVRDLALKGRDMSSINEGASTLDTQTSTTKDILARLASYKGYIWNTLDVCPTCGSTVKHVHA